MDNMENPETPENTETPQVTGAYEMTTNVETGEVTLTSLEFPEVFVTIDTRGEKFEVFREGAWGSPEIVDTGAEALDKAEVYLVEYENRHREKVSKMESVRAAFDSKQKEEA